MLLPTGSVSFDDGNGDEKLVTMSALLKARRWRYFIVPRNGYLWRSFVAMSRVTYDDGVHVLVIALIVSALSYCMMVRSNICRSLLSCSGAFYFSPLSPIVWWCAQIVSALSYHVIVHSNHHCSLL